MFEMGARTHPPRALDRSYLDQSDVFVGIYWQRYGWVAPDMEISGLEDEYVLSAGMPAYHEATSPRNRGLYERHGYVTQGEFTLPDGPTLWRMSQRAPIGQRPATARPRPRLV